MLCYSSPRSCCVCQVPRESYGLLKIGLNLSLENPHFGTLTLALLSFDQLVSSCLFVLNPTTTYCHLFLVSSSVHMLLDVDGHIRSQSEKSGLPH